MKSNTMSWKSSWTVALTTILGASSIWLPTSHAAAVPFDSLSARAKVPFASGVELRVLPIGDSITNGVFGSADAAGYRSRLYNAMFAKWSNAINFVGSITSGNFSQNHHEGHSGYLIQEIQNSSQVGIYQSPNIVLLHAGTNDMIRGSAAGSPANLTNLIDDIFSKSTNTTIFVCKLIPTTNPDVEAKIETFNKQIENIAKTRYFNKKLVVVDMWTNYSTTYLNDGLHPNEAGYQEMANRFLKAISDNEKLVTKPGIARSPPK